MTESTDQFQAHIAHHAERQTSAIEKIRDYVFYLLLIVVVGLIFGVIVGISGSTGF